MSHLIQCKCLSFMSSNTLDIICIPTGVQVFNDNSNNNKSFINMVQLSSLKATNNETFGEILKRLESVCEETCENDDCESIIYNPIIMDTFVADSPAIALSIP